MGRKLELSSEKFKAKGKRRGDTVSRICKSDGGDQTGTTVVVFVRCHCFFGDRGRCSVSCGCLTLALQLCNNICMLLIAAISP